MMWKQMFSELNKYGSFKRKAFQKLISVFLTVPIIIPDNRHTGYYNMVRILEKKKTHKK